MIFGAIELGCRIMQRQVQASIVLQAAVNLQDEPQGPEVLCYSSWRKTSALAALCHFSVVVLIRVAKI